MSEIKKELDKLNQMVKDGISFNGRKFQHENLKHYIENQGKNT